MIESGIMKLRKRILSLILAVAMLSIFCQTAVAVSEKYFFSVDSVTAVCGGIVEVPVRVENNGGLQGFLLILNYDKDSVTPIDVKCGEAFSEGSIETNLKKLTPGELRVVGYSGTENSEDGTLFTVVFEVSDFAKNSVSMNLSYDSSNTYDAQLNDVDADCESGTLTIEGATSTEMMLFADDVSGICGETVDVPIKIKNYNAAQTLSGIIKYDSASLELVEMNSPKAQISKSGQEGNISFTLSTISNISDNDVILNARFKIKAVGEFAILLESTMEDLVCKGCYLVGKEDVSSKPTFCLTEALGKVNETVTVKAAIKNNPGVMGFKVTLKYDAEAMSPLAASVTAGEVIKGKGSLSNNVKKKASTGEVSFLWNGSGEVTSDGILFQLDFELKDNCGEYKLEISYSKPDTFNEAWEDLDFECVDSVVSIAEEYWILANDTSEVKIDYNTNYIYGIEPGTTDLTQYIKPIDGCTLKIDSSKTAIGTSTKVFVYDETQQVAVYTVIIFGDLNSDGMCDGQDAVVAECLTNGLIDDCAEELVVSADCNHDGAVNSEDVVSMINSGIFLATIGQGV